MNEVTTEPCIGCGAVVPCSDGPTHRYLGASPGCWEVYGEVLAREFSDARYWPVHALTVDTYAVQHPGTSSPQTIRSTPVHLTGLYFALELDYPSSKIAGVRQTVLDSVRDELTWLDPPASVGSMTVLDVAHASCAEEYVGKVDAWARSAWEAWAPHHETVRRLVDAAWQDSWGDAG